MFEHFFGIDGSIKPLNQNNTIAYFMIKAKEVSESRFQRGIHFKTDNEAALELGQKVGNEIVKKLKIV